MNTIPDGLWRAGRSEADLRRLYDEWAARYDEDMAAGGMLGPRRVAEAMAAAVTDTAAPILDFGCGTGQSGVALREAGFTDIRGVDLSDGMLARARGTGAYADLALTEPDAPLSVLEGVAGVSACGSICIGAGPASLLRAMLEAMPEGVVLVASFNDDTLRDTGYMRALADVQVDGLARLERAEYGPQLPALGRGATILTLTRL